MDEDQVQPTDENEEKDRTTEQFDKLTKSNQDLKDQLDLAKEEADKYKKLADTPVNKSPDAKQFSNLNQQQVDQTFSSMIDESGFLDGNKLMNVLGQMNQRAIQAEERAMRAEETAKNSQQSLSERSEKEAKNKVFSKFPQLDPENKETFDPKMHRAVFDRLAVKAKAGEYPKDEDYMEAANSVYEDFYKDNDMGKKVDEQKQEKETQKQQVNAIKPSSNQQAGFYADQNDDNLLQQVQNGKRGALAEMLKRRGQ